MLSLVISIRRQEIAAEFRLQLTRGLPADEDGQDGSGCWPKGRAHSGVGTCHHSQKISGAMVRPSIVFDQH